MIGRQAAWPRPKALLISLLILAGLMSATEAQQDKNNRTAIVNHLRTNDNLSIENHAYLPTDLKAYLKLFHSRPGQVFKQSGFSRALHGDFILATNDLDGVGYKSRAALVTILRDGSFRWKPLSLPFVFGDKITVRDSYQNAAWNEKLQALEVRECSDIIHEFSPIQCLRFIYRVGSDETSILRIDSLSTHDVIMNTRENWVPYWEVGKGKLEPR